MSEPASGPGREGLDELSETNLSVTLLARWPSQLVPGRVEPRLSSTLDIFPTCLAAARASVPTELPMDGVNLLPYLQRRINKAPHAVLQWRTTSVSAIRQGEWKLVRDLRADAERFTTIRETPTGFSEIATNDARRLQTTRAAWDAWNQAPTRPAWTRWDSEINAFAEFDRTNKPPQNAILFAGSSTIRLWKTLAADFPEHKVINRGFGGSEIADSVAYFDKLVVPYRPKTIVFYAGDNDLASGRWPEQLLVDFQSFVFKVHAALPSTKVFFLAIKPSPSRRGLIAQTRLANRLIQDYCRGKSAVEFVDVFTPTLGPNGQPRPELFVQDELHLNTEGYSVWTTVLKPLLK